MAVDLPTAAAAVFSITIILYLAASGRLRPKGSPPVVREGWIPGLGNLYGFVSGPRGPLDFIARAERRGMKAPRTLPLDARRRGVLAARRA